MYNSLMEVCIIIGLNVAVATNNVSKNHLEVGLLCWQVRANARGAAMLP